MSPLGFWPGGGGVCPKLRLKGRRGRVTTASKLPATRSNPGGFIFNKRELFHMILRLLFALLFGFSLAGCAAGVSHMTQSGRVETTVNGVSISRVKSHLTNMMIDKRYVAARSDDTVLVFERTIEDSVAQLMLSSRMNKSPVARVTYNLIDNGPAIRIIGDFAAISNPGTGFENRYDMNGHPDTITMQNALTHMKTQLESKR